MLGLHDWSVGLRRQSLLTVDQVPPSHREPAIITGYRPHQSTPAQCLASVFVAHNETLNFWTHFIPAWYFVWKLIDLGTVTLDFYNDSYTCAFLAYMLTICVYPLISCSAHAFSSMSDSARHICYFLDYGALSIYSYGAGILYRSYVLPRDLLGSAAFCTVFTYGCLVCAILCTVSACYSRFTASPLALKILRLGAFALPFAWMSLPLLLRLVQCAEIDECGAASLSHHARQFVVAIFGAFAYALHVPERLAPGRFDIVGHSHQWLHICGILATHEQMHGALLDLQERRDLIVRSGGLLSQTWVVNSAVFVVLVDAAIIAAFSSFVLKEDKKAS